MSNADHKSACERTPLTAEAILKLVVENLEYFGDPYYYELWAAVQKRAEEYFATRPEAERPDGW